MSNNFYKDSRLLGYCTKASRVLGLIRDNLCGRIFGTSIEFGAFTFAFKLPNLFRRLFGEGALSAAYIPELVKTRESQTEDAAKNLTNSLFTCTLILLTLICLISVTIILGLLFLTNPTEEWQYILKFSAIMLPYLVFICLTALMGATLNTLKHFLIPAMAPIVFNLTWITGIIIAWQMKETKYDRLILICWAILISGILQMALQLKQLKKMGWQFRFAFDYQSPQMQNIFRNVLPVAFSMAIFQLNVFMDSVIAAAFTTSDHALAALYYSDRIQQLPLGIISISIATAIYPLLSRLHANKQTDEFRTTLTKAIRGLLYLSLPCLIGLICLKEALVVLFFSFKNPESIQQTSQALHYYSLGIVCTCTTPILTRSFYATGQLKLPVKIGIAMVILNCSLNIILVHTTDLQGAAIALGTSITSCVNFIFLFIFAFQKLQAININEITSHLLKIITPSLIMLLFLLFALQSPYSLKLFDSNFLGLSTYSLKIITLVPLSIIIFTITSLFLKTPELKEIISRR